MVPGVTAVHVIAATAKCVVSSCVPFSPRQLGYIALVERNGALKQFLESGAFEIIESAVGGCQFWQMNRAQRKS